MKSTSEDALNLIRHRHHEDVELRCTCTNEAAGVSLTGRVAELSDAVLSIKGTASETFITLDGAIVWV